MNSCATTKEPIRDSAAPKFSATGTLIPSHIPIVRELTDEELRNLAIAVWVGEGGALTKEDGAE